MECRSSERQINHWYIINCIPLLLCVALLGGCNDKSSISVPETEKPPEVVLRLALQANRANKAWEAADLVRQELELQSGGRIKVMFYDSGSLGAERQLLETCYLGVIEMVQCTSSVATTIDPKFSLLDMPYLFLDEEHHQKVMNGPIGCELLEGLREHRLQGLAFYSCGFRHIFNSRGRKICKPADLAGIKIRVMESPVMLDSLNAMGASATPLSASELFQSLKTGVVDAAENNPQVFVSEKYHAAMCKNFSLTGHFANQHVLVCNKKWFDHLGKTHPDLQKLVKEVPQQILDRYNKQWNQALDDAFKEMREQGVEINRVDNLDPFIERVEPVYDAFFSEYPSVPRELVDQIRKAGRK